MKIKWEFIVIIALLGLFVFRECSRPQSLDFGTEAFKDTIEVLRQEKAIVQSRQEATVKTYNARLKEDSLNLARQDSRIKALQTKLTNQRPKVIEKIQADTSVLSYVNTLEEVVTEQQVQIDTLKSALEFHAKINQDLIAQEFVEDRIEADMAIQNTRRIAELDKQSRKNEQGKKGWKILAIVGTVLGIVGGSQL